MHTYLLFVPALAILVAGVALVWSVVAARRQARSHPLATSSSVITTRPELPACPVVCETCPGRLEEKAAVLAARARLRGKGLAPNMRSLAELERVRVASRVRHHWRMDTERGGFSCVHCPVFVETLPGGESADPTIDRESFAERRTMLVQRARPEGSSVTLRRMS